MKTYLKPSNLWAIHDAFLLNQDDRVQGSKLIALHKLIHKKGEIVNISGQQIKALRIEEKTFIAMKVTHVKKDSFFPCMIKKHHLKQL